MGSCGRVLHRFCGVMVSMLTSSVVDRGFAESGQRVSDMSTRGLLFQ